MGNCKANSATATGSKLELMKSIQHIQSLASKVPAKIVWRTVPAVLFKANIELAAFICKVTALQPGMHVLDEVEGYQRSMGDAARIEVFRQGL